MAQQIQVRRDTSANWTSAATVLAAGEIGFETNTGKFKIGDGSTAWASLTYFNPAGGGGGATNLAYTASPTNGVVTSDTGTDATVSLADGTNAGLMAPAQHTKLAGIETGATADMTAAEILAALLTVDGSGSGLDADLLDGQSSAVFLTAATAATTYQPLDSDLTAIAALTTTSYGRAFLALANQAATMALLSAASDTASGIVELATTAEVTTGTDTTRAVTAAGVKAVADLKLSLLAGGAAVENIGAVEANVNTVAATGSTETLDTSVYQVHDCTMDQNCTFTFSNPAPSGKCSSFVLILRGAFTPTLPAAVKWSSAAAPTYTTPAVYTFTTVDAGTTWLGAQVGRAFA